MPVTTAAGVVQVAVDKVRMAEVDELLKGIANGTNRACAAAVNKTLDTAKSQIVRRLAKELSLKTSYIRDTISIKKAIDGGKGLGAVLYGFVKISTREIPLYQFAPKPSEPQVKHVLKKRKGQLVPVKVKGVSIKAMKGKGRQLIRGTFIAKMKSGHVGIYKRLVKGSLPIRELKGPTPAGVFDKAPGLAGEVLSELGEVLEKNLDSQINRLLNRKKADA